MPWIRMCQIVKILYIKNKTLKRDLARKKNEYVTLGKFKCKSGREK